MTHSPIYSPRTGTSIERYIRLIGRYYLGAVIVMTLLIGATVMTVQLALERHATQQEISFLTSRQFILFQQLANQTRAVMSASTESRIPEYIIAPMVEEARQNIAAIRSTIDRLEAMNARLERNLLERLNNRKSTSVYDGLNARLDSFLSRAERVVESSHEDRARRYTYWGPIDFALSADSVLIRQFNDVIQQTHERSGASIDNAALISTLLLFTLALIFILASVLLFYPLLTKLRNEHVHKMDFERRLTHLAHTDAITSLKNRSFFNDMLHELFRRVEKDKTGFSLLLIDLDHFKAINDSYGHAAGDAALRHVAEALNENCRGNDIIARIGGDEFAILLPEVTNESSLRLVAERVVESIGREFPFEGRTLRVSASIGGAIAPTHAKDEPALVRAADLALYTAKSDRNGAIIFNRSSFAVRLQQNELAETLSGAAERNEFIPNYQPKICLKTGRLLGFEALVRWKHPQLGMLPPHTFLPLMEGTDLIKDMTAAMVKVICRDLLAWRESGLAPVPIAINMPEALLVTDNGFDLLSSAIEEYGLSWSHFTVEVTEDVFLNRHAERLFASMSRFREQGVCVSLDDFGTGFASLVHLRDFPFDELKIDRCFVADIGLEDRSEQIIRTIIDLARNLGKRCVAEGIETEAQRDFLLSAGCKEGQGYLFDKAMPEAEARRRLERSRNNSTAETSPSGATAP